MPFKRTPIRPSTWGFLLSLTNPRRLLSKISLHQILDLSTDQLPFYEPVPLGFSTQNSPSPLPQISSFGLLPPLGRKLFGNSNSMKDSQVVILALNHPNLAFDLQISPIISDAFSLLPAPFSWKARNINGSTNFCAHFAASWATPAIYQYAFTLFLFPTYSFLLSLEMISLSLLFVVLVYLYLYI